MLLVEIGYDAKAAGMTGTDWAINTSKLIATTEPDERHLTAPSTRSSPVRRPLRCALNALKTPTVDV